MQPDDDIAIFCRCPPLWDHIAPLRTFLVGYANPVIGRDASAEAGMIANELLENAIKYGDVTGGVEFTVRHHRSDARIVVEVRNKAQPARITRLRREYQRYVNSDAKEAFSQAVGRSMQFPVETSMLGLARIMSRADLRLAISGPEVRLEAHIGRFPEASSRGRLKTSRLLTPISGKTR